MTAFSMNHLKLGTQAMDNTPVTRQSLLNDVKDARNEWAWHRFIDIYQPLVANYCRKRGFQDADVMDITQDVMASVATAMPQFEYDPSKGRFRAWLFQVVRSKLCDYANKQKRQPKGTGETVVHQMLAEKPGPEAEADWDRDCQRRLFEWAASRVKDEFEAKSWDAFWRTAVGQEKPKAVAEALGMSVGAVYIAKSRITARIRSIAQSRDESN